MILMFFKLTNYTTRQGRWHHFQPTWVCKGRRPPVDDRLMFDEVEHLGRNTNFPPSSELGLDSCPGPIRSIEPGQVIAMQDHWLVIVITQHRTEVSRRVLSCCWFSE